MSYFSEWNERVENDKDQERFNAFVTRYYELEQNAYKTIFESYPEEKLQGTALEVQEYLGFEGDMVIFLGFMEGLNPALDEELDLDSITEDTPLDLTINYEQLLYNMHDAKAAWLFELTAWDNVLPKEMQILKAEYTEETESIMSRCAFVEYLINIEYSSY